MLKIAFLAGVVVVGAALLVVIIGLLLPKSHLAARSLSLHRSPEEVFRLISDVKAAPAWRPDVRSVELLEPLNGHIRFREKGRNGAITMEVVESNSPSRMVTRIADQGRADDVERRLPPRRWRPRRRPKRPSCSSPKRPGCSESLQKMARRGQGFRPPSAT